MLAHRSITVDAWFYERSLERFNLKARSQILGVLILSCFYGISTGKIPASCKYPIGPTLAARFLNRTGKGGEGSVEYGLQT
jgi:hypothetical protein